MLVEELRKALKAHRNELYVHRKVTDKSEKCYADLLGELDNVLKIKEELVEFYSEVLIQGVNKNRQEYINNLNIMSGRVKADVTMNELKDLKDSTEYARHKTRLELEALLAIFGCLEAVSEYDHVTAVTKLFRLKTTVEDYVFRFVTKNKNYVKIFLWQWVKHAFNVLEAKIAFYFNPFFVSQALALESAEEETKLGNLMRERRAEPILLDRKFCLFDKIREFGSEFQCQIFILLDRSLLRSQPNLIFDANTEATWMLLKGFHLIKIYEYARDEKLGVDEKALTRLALLVNTKSMKLDESAEPLENFAKDKFKFFVVPIDVAVYFSVIASDLYGKKKYSDKIKKAIKVITAELRSFSITNKLRELTSSN